MWEVGVEDGHPQHTTTITMRLNRIYDQRQHALPRSFDHPMTTITAPTVGIIDNTISVSVEKDLNADARMTNSNVMITQDDSMAASTGGLLLSQDTISSVDFVDSQQHETTDLAAAVTAIKQQPLLPPPLLVQCPNVSDVLFPMEGFKMWPANVYCEIILQQYEAKCIAIGDIQERQAKLVQDIIHLIRSHRTNHFNSYRKQQQQQHHGTFSPWTVQLMPSLDTSSTASSGGDCGGIGSILHCAKWTC